MKTNIQIPIIRAAALILAVAATTLAIKNTKLDTNHLAMFSYDESQSLLTKSRKISDCVAMERKLFHSEKAQRKPKDIFANLKANPDQYYHAPEMLLYIDLNPEEICEGVDAERFLWFTSLCNKAKGLHPMIEFVKSYAPEKFKQCALKILTNGPDKKLSLIKAESREEPLRELIKAGLKINGEKVSDEELNERVRKMDPGRNELNVIAMTKMNAYYYKKMKNIVLSGNPLFPLFQFLTEQCTIYRQDYFREVGIVNLARAMKVISEKDLTPRFLLINKLILFCAQFLSNKASMAIKEKLQSQWSKTRHTEKFNYQGTASEIPQTLRRTNT